MRLVVFGLTVSSSWGNGHATLWRGLIAALHAAGHHVTFFERDTEFYAQNRDIAALPGGGELVLYREFDHAQSIMRRVLGRCDAAIVTSFCPDGAAATSLLSEASCVRLFYDLDTPVTLARLAAGTSLPELGPEQLRPFDVVLSYTGGPALDALRTRLGARRVMPLYGWADEMAYRPAPPRPDVSPAAMTYLGTYAADRQDALERLLIEPARRRPGARFVIGGAQYPTEFPWTDNIWFVRHVPPPDHPGFYAAGQLTLNITRAAMAQNGWCPSGRLFEAASCGTAILSDRWHGLDEFFEPDREILLADSTDEALAALDAGEAALARMAARARERVLGQHTARHRAQALVALIGTMDRTVAAA